MPYNAKHLIITDLYPSYLQWNLLICSETNRSPLFLLLTMISPFTTARINLTLFSNFNNSISCLFNKNIDYAIISDFSSNWYNCIQIELSAFSSFGGLNTLFHLIIDWKSPRKKKISTKNCLKSAPSRIENQDINTYTLEK